MKFLLGIIIMLLSLSQSSGKDKLTVILDWFVNPDHAPLIIAEEKGFFEREGLDVELVPPADPSLPPRLVAAGRGDIAISYQPNLYFHIKEDLPLVWIGTLVETPLNALVVLKDGPIKNLQDLKGRKVGFSVGGFEEALLGTMLEEIGLSLSDIELINVNFSLSPSLMSGNVDAVIGAFRNFELNQLQINGKLGKAYYPEEHGVPIYDELIFLARRSEDNDPRFEKFLRALEDATIYLTNHPDEALTIFFNKYPHLNNELNRLAWYDTLPRFAKRPSAIDIKRYQNFAQFMYQRGLIDKIPSIDQIIQPMEEKSDK